MNLHLVKQKPKFFNIKKKVIGTQAKGKILAIQIRHTVFMFGNCKGDNKLKIKILTPLWLIKFNRYGIKNLF